MKIVALGVCIMAAFTVMSATNETAKSKRISRGGGYVAKPGTMKGRIVFLDCQDKFKRESIESITNKFWTYKDGHFNFVVEKGTLAPSTKEPNSLEVAKILQKADVLIAIVDDDVTPILMAAPEDYIAAVNVRKIVKGLKNEDIATVGEARYRKELLRALAYATSSASTQFPNNIISLSTLEEFDKVDAFLPADSFTSMVKRLKKIGVKPEYVTSYLNACEEGWASQPRDENQKRIWDHVHEIPKNPMKIEFDPKKGR